MQIHASFRTKRPVRQKLEFETPMDRHVVLTLGRSGSNTLTDMLNQNPDILNVGEVLGDWNVLRKVQRRLRLYPQNADYLDAMLRKSVLIRVANTYRNHQRRKSGAKHEIKRLSDIKTLGIKEFSLNMHEFGVADYLHARPDIKVIGLLRDNVLDRAMSYIMLRETGVVAVRDNTTGKQQVEIDPEELISILEDVKSENQGLQAMLDELPSERVEIVQYAEFFSDEESRIATMRRLFDFLGVQQHQPVVRMKKILQRPKSEMISNIEACRATLLGTEFEGLLDE